MHIVGNWRTITKEGRMSISQEKVAELEARRRLVRQLWQFGLSLAEIAQVLQKTVTMIKNDCRILGLAAKDRTMKSDQKLAALLQGYAEVVVGDGTRDDVLQQLLERHPWIRELTAFVDGVVMNRLVMSNAGTQLPTGYARLLKTVFGEEVYNEEINSPESNRREAITDLLRQVLGGLTLTSMHEARLHLVQIVAEQFDFGDVLLGFNPEATITVVDEVLETLSESDRELLRLRFGLGCDTRSVADIAEMRALRPDRIRGDISNALRVLRRPKHVRHLYQHLDIVRSAMRDRDDLMTRVVEQETEIRRLHERARELGVRLTLPHPKQEDLDRHVDEFEFSVRTTNCLQHAKIRYIGQLVQRTEAQMLKIPLFGRKSLKEVKETLAEMGLSLGMKIDGWEPPPLPIE